MKKNLFTTLLIVLSFSFLSVAQQQELIDDGSFDQASPNWIQILDFHITNNTMYTGACTPNGYAWFADISGGYPVDGSFGYIYQSISIAPNSTGVNLTFWYSITTQDPGASVSDLFNVQIYSNGSWSTIYVKSNLDAGPCTYSGNIDLSSFIGQTILVGFVASTDQNGFGTKFRVDDVSVLEDLPTGCVTWLNGTPTNPTFVAAAEVLCQAGIIYDVQDNNALNQIPRFEVADDLFNGLFGIGGSSYSDYFPTPFIDLNTLPFQDQQGYKTALYLEFGDNEPAFSRDNFLLSPWGTIERGKALKAIFEAWNMPSSSAYPNNFNDVTASNPYYKYIVTASFNGYLTNTSIQSCGFPPCFNTTDFITRQDIYIILANIISSGFNPPLPTQNDYFLPNTFETVNLGNQASIDRGVFNNYEDPSYVIPSGGLPLVFEHSYHSNWIELPYATNEGLSLNWFRQMQSSLGVGWTHSYNIRIRKVFDQNNFCSKLLIWWPEGILHVYDNITHQYETRGVTDELSVDSVNPSGTPVLLTITKKNGIKYKFNGLLPNPFFDLFLNEIRDRNNNSISLGYLNGISVDGYDVLLIGYVRDNFSNRGLDFQYQNGTNYLESVIDNYGGRTIHFSVNALSENLESFTDSKGQTTNYQYDPADPHMLNHIQRPKGNTIDNTYFKKKLLSSSTGAYNVAVNFNTSYLGGSQTTNSQVSVNQGGNTYTTYVQHDDRGNPVSVTLPAGNITVQYNDANNPDQPTYIHDNSTGISQTLSYEPNPKANITQLVTNGGGQTLTESWLYDSYNDVIEHHAPNGVVTNNSYDANGNLTDINQPNNVHYHFQINPTTHLLDYSVSPVGVITNCHYNYFGNLDSVYISGTNISAAANYDGDSRLIATKDANSVRTQYSYDANDNPLDTRYDSLGLNYLTKRRYDANGNLLSIVAPKGDSTILTYAFQTDALINETYGNYYKNWTYNSDGTLNSFINKNAFTFQYQYYPQADPNAGKVLSDGYTTFLYDNITHNLLKAVRNLDQISYTYDGLNRPTIVSYNDVPANDVQYEYYTNSTNLHYIHYPQFNGFPQFHAEYIYDANNRLFQVKNSTTGLPFVTYFYHEDGQLDYEQLGNGLRTYYYYDNAARLDSIVTRDMSLSVIAAVGCTLDAVGNHTDESYIANYSGPGGAPNGDGDSTISFQYDYMNRQTNAGPYSLTYDNNGNLISNGNISSSYSWDERNILTSATISGSPVSFESDPLGNRRRRDTTRYILDLLNNSNVLMETNLSAIPSSIYVYGLGLVCRIDPSTGATFYYHYDFRGSTIAISDSGKTVNQTYDYNAFGRLTGGQGFPTMFENPFRYVGKFGVVYDDYNHYYMRARYYTPRLHRFISEDPVWGENLFPYCDNNPLSNIDPDGEFAFLIPMLGGAATSIATGYTLAKLTGQKYTAGNALSDGLIGLVSGGIGKFLTSASRIAKVHGNSLKSLKPTWGYKLYSKDGTFLKNGITSELIPEKRYTRSFMSDKFMEKFPFPNRLDAYNWESIQNQILKGPLNFNMH